MGLFDTIAGCLIAGVDEAGRGPLAGPVVAGAVILCPTRLITGLRDSKKLTQAQRDTLALEIRHLALAVGVGQASVEEIDALNILRASHLAMCRAISNLSFPPDLVLVDGNLLPPLNFPAIALVKGDDRIDAISAGAILAKTERDRQMTLLADLYPQYGFAQHKGYATRQHLLALKKHGPSPIHRRSFAPVREADGHARQTSLFAISRLIEVAAT
jgi:ribonuclease HII